MTFTEPRLDPSEHSTMTTSLDLSFTDSNAVNETLEKIVDYVDLHPPTFTAFSQTPNAWGCNCPILQL